MKGFVFILVVVCVAGIFFWNDIFGGDDDNTAPEQDSIKVLDVEDDGKGIEPEQDEASKTYVQLIKENKWEAALGVLDMIPGLNDNVQHLVAKHYCLIQLDRKEEAEQVMNMLLEKDPSSPSVVLSVIHSIDKSTLSPLEVRKRLSIVSKGFGALDPGRVALLVAAMKKINTALPRSIEGLVKTEDYTIKSNDSLWKICNDANRNKNINVEVGLIKMLNGLTRDIIHPGDVLKIPKETVSIKIWRDNWLMTVFVGETLFCAFPVGLGSGDSTPVGDFLIKKKLENPDWYSEKHGKIIPFGNKENVLGTRWLGFENQPNARGLGIHGTVDNSSIGKNLSSGCIRLTNTDVEALFDIIARKTPVKIF